MADYKDVLPLLEEGYQIGLRDKNVSDLLGISAGSLNRAKNGVQPLPAQDWLNVKNLILDCKELSRRNSLPILWSDLRAVRRELDALNDERRNPPLEPSAEDRDIFERFTRGEDVLELSVRYRIDKMEVLNRVQRVIRHSDFLAQRAAAVQQ